MMESVRSVDIGILGLGECGWRLYAQKCRTATEIPSPSPSLNRYCLDAAAKKMQQATITAEFLMKYTSLLAITGLLLLTACSQNIGQLKAMELKGDDFSAHLAREYRSYVLALDEDSERERAQYFAAKGLLAANHESVEPERIAENKGTPLSVNTLEHMTESRLMLTSQLKDTSPDRREALARAQVFFDCWVAEAIEHPSHAEGCQGSFRQAMDKLESVNAQSPDYVLYFRSESARLTENARNVVRQIAMDVYDTPVKKIHLTGYTDSYGDAEYNEALAQQRSENTSEALVRAGIPAEKIVIALRKDKASGSKEQRKVEVRVFPKKQPH